MRSLKVLALGFIIAAAPAVWAQSNPSSATPAKPADPKAKPAAAAPTKPAAQPSKQASTPASKPQAAQAPAPATKAPAQKPQAPASNPQAANPPAGTPKPQSAKPQTPAPKPQSAAKAPAKPAAKPQATKRAAKAAPKKKPVERPASTATASSSAPEGEVPKGARRDPFESLISRQQNAANAAKLLPPGKAGLQVSTLRLDGIVKAPNGMIAVVTNPQSRTYFLREGDQLYDGRVEKIAMDGVSFHEVGKDAFGKPIERQVQKRIYSSTPGEQQ
jgi:hypothetical protein